MCLILSSAIIMVRPLDLEDQIVFFTQCDFDVLVCVEEDPGELGSTRRVLAIVIDLCFFSRCILEYNLSSFAECDAKLLTAESRHLARPGRHRRFVDHFRTQSLSRGPSACRQRSVVFETQVGLQRGYFLDLKYPLQTQTQAGIDLDSAVYSTLFRLLD